jgi:hypothetical protein
MKLTTHIHLVLRLRMSGAILLNPPVCIHGVEKNSFSILLLVLMVHLCLVKQFHFDIKVCTVYLFSFNFSYTFLGTVTVSNQTNICFTCAALLGLLFDAAVASVISLLQYLLKYLSSKTFCELLYI